jgi:hypothetical protein
MAASLLHFHQLHSSILCPTVLVPLSAIGFVAPNPLAVSRDAAIPLPVSHATTACARFSESA